MKEKNSPYSASVTGCGFMLEEMTSVLPLLMAENADELLRKEVLENKYLRINTEGTRSRAVTEFKLRYKAVKPEFWEHYLTLSLDEQRLAMWFVMLKTYEIFFEFQVKGALKNWRGISQELTKADVMMVLTDIAAVDSFVDSWSDLTKGKVAGSFLTALRKVGFLDKESDQLRMLHFEDHVWQYYIQIGEAWFPDACFLPIYEVERLKQSML